MGQPAPMGDNQDSVQTAAFRAVDYTLYLWHLIKDKPVLVAVGSIISSIAGKVEASLPDHALNLMAIAVLVAIDFVTKVRACRVTGEPVSSKVMRDKGLPKLRDYLLLYVAGAMTTPLFGDVWGLRAVMYFLAMCELWSIAENLYDSGNLPFDIRKMAIFDGIRQLMTGGTMEAPISGPLDLAARVFGWLRGDGSTDAPKD